MSTIRVEVVGAEHFQEAERMLADVPGGMDRALKSAAMRATSFLRTQSTKEIRKRYDITRKDIRAERNITTRFRYFNGVEAIVTFKGKKIPLFRYGGAAPKEPTVNAEKTVMAIVNGQLRPVHPSVAASGHQLTSTGPTTFSNAFVARMKSSGHVGIFERTGGKTVTGDAAIKEIMGSSVPQMLGSEEVQESLVEKTMGKMEERLTHEVNRILNGWGG